MEETEVGLVFRLSERVNEHAKRFYSRYTYVGPASKAGC